jgi:hypothetical protein
MENDEGFDLETPEAMERALDLIAARRSGTAESYGVKLARVTTEAYAGGVDEVARTLHAFARYASSATALVAALVPGDSPAKAFQRIAAALTDETDAADDDERG